MAQWISSTFTELMFYANASTYNLGLPFILLLSLCHLLGLIEGGASIISHFPGVGSIQRDSEAPYHL